MPGSLALSMVHQPPILASARKQAMFCFVSFHFVSWLVPAHLLHVSDQAAVDGHALCRRRRQLPPLPCLLEQPGLDEGTPAQGEGREVGSWVGWEGARRLLGQQAHALRCTHLPPLQSDRLSPAHSSLPLSQAAIPRRPVPLPAPAHHHRQAVVAIHPALRLVVCQDISVANDRHAAMAGTFGSRGVSPGSRDACRESTSLGSYSQPGNLEHPPVRRSHRAH